jgi:enoyl-CoA hydratase
MSRDSQFPYESFDNLSVELQDDGVAILRLGRPDGVGKVSPVFHRELEIVFQAIARDGRIKVLMLTGAGRTFSAGGDLEWMESPTDPYDLELSVAEGRRIIEAMISLHQPVIAAINGAAIGLGCTIALFSDITVAGDDVKIGDPHVALGLVCGDGGAVIWPLLVGLHRANRYLLTAELLTGAKAAEIGLVGEAVPRVEVFDHALTLARRIAALPGPAVRGTKRSTVRHLAQAVFNSLEFSLEKERTSLSTDEHRAAVAAFIAKQRAHRAADDR